MREVGAQLRQRRLARGEDLDDVARALRIKPSYLFGIEQGDLSALPGRPYALGFVRSYADYLGFDGDDLVSRIKASVADLTDRSRLRIRLPLPENRLPRTPVVVLSLAILLGVYGAWSYTYESSRMTVETVAEVPAELRERAVSASTLPAGNGEPPEEVVSGGAAATTASSASAAAAPGPSDTAQAPAAPSEAGAGSSGQAPAEMVLHDDPDRLAVQPAAGADYAHAERSDGGQAPDGAPLDQAVPALGPAGEAPRAMQVLALLDPTAGGSQGPQVYGRGNVDARVILRAREAAWVQVSSPSGDYAFTRTLQPGEALLVPNRPDLELWTGNAAGLEVIVDGTAVPALPPGRLVQRHVSLDPDRLLAAAQERR